MRQLVPFYLSSVILVLAVSACGDDEEPISDVSDVADTSVDTADTADSEVSTDVIEDAPEGDVDLVRDTGNEIDTTPDPSCGFNWVVQVSGDIIDADGAPVDAAKAQVCVRQGEGQLVCLSPGTASAEGEFTVTVPESARCVSEGTIRAFKPRFQFATSYCHIPEAETPLLAIDAPIVLHPTTAAVSAPEYTDPEQMVTVEFADGMEIDVVPKRVFTTSDSYAAISSSKIDVNAPGLCFLNDENRPDHLWGFSPEADVLGASLDFRVPNTFGYAPGATIGLYTLGGISTTLADGELVPEGEWVRYGAATVSEDGSMVVGAADAGGIRAISWLGFKAE